MVKAGTLPLDAIGRPAAFTGMRRGLPPPARGFDGDVGWKAPRCAISRAPAGRRRRCRRRSATWTCVTRAAIAPVPASGRSAPCVRHQTRVGGPYADLSTASDRQKSVQSSIAIDDEDIPRIPHSRLGPDFGGRSAARFKHALHQLRCERAGARCAADEPFRRPFQAALMRGGPTRIDGGVCAHLRAARVTGHTLVPMKALHGQGRVPQPNPSDVRCNMFILSRWSGSMVRDGCPLMTTTFPTRSVLRRQVNPRLAFTVDPLIGQAFASIDRRSVPFKGDLGRP